MENEYYAYQLIDSSAPFTPFYFGKGKGNRMHRHKRDAITGTHYNKHLQRKIRKILRDGNDVIAEKIIENVTDVDALAMEVEVIKFYTDIDVTICNKTMGGEGMSGFKRTKKQRMNSSRGAKRRYKDPEEHRKASERSTKILQNPDVRKKISLAKIEFYKNPEEREKQGKRSREANTQKIAVIRLSDGKIYSSLKDCGLDNNTDSSTIKRDCNSETIKSRIKQTYQFYTP